MDQAQPGIDFGVQTGVRGEVDRVAPEVGVGSAVAVVPDRPVERNRVPGTGLGRRVEQQRLQVGDDPGNADGQRFGAVVGFAASLVNRAAGVGEHEEVIVAVQGDRQFDRLAALVGFPDIQPSLVDVGAELDVQRGVQLGVPGEVDSVGPVGGHRVAGAAVGHLPGHGDRPAGIAGGRGGDVGDDQVGRPGENVDRAAGPDIVQVVQLHHLAPVVGPDQQVAGAADGVGQGDGQLGQVGVAFGQGVEVGLLAQAEVAGIQAGVLGEIDRVGPAVVGRGGGAVIDHRETDGQVAAGGGAARGGDLQHLQVGGDQGDVGGLVGGPDVVVLGGVFVDIVVAVGPDQEVAGAADSGRQGDRERGLVTLLGGERSALVEVAQVVVAGVQAGVLGEEDLVGPPAGIDRAVAVVLHLPAHLDRLARGGHRRRGDRDHLQVGRSGQRDREGLVIQVVILQAFAHPVIGVGRHQQVIAAFQSVGQPGLKGGGVGILRREVTAVARVVEQSVDVGLELGVQREVGGVVPERGVGGAVTGVLDGEGEGGVLTGEGTGGRVDHGNFQVGHRAHPDLDRLGGEAAVVILGRLEALPLVDVVVEIGHDQQVDAALALQQVARDGDGLDAGDAGAGVQAGIVVEADQRGVVADLIVAGEVDVIGPDSADIGQAPVFQLPGQIEGAAGPDLGRRFGALDPEIGHRYEGYRDMAVGHDLVDLEGGITRGVVGAVQGVFLIGETVGGDRGDRGRLAVEDILAGREDRAVAGGHFGGHPGITQDGIDPRRLVRRGDRDAVGGGLVAPVVVPARQVAGVDLVETDPVEALVEAGQPVSAVGAGSGRFQEGAARIVKVNPDPGQVTAAGVAYPAGDGAGSPHDRIDIGDGLRGGHRYRVGLGRLGPAVVPLVQVGRVQPAAGEEDPVTAGMEIADRVGTVGAGRQAAGQGIVPGVAYRDLDASQVDGIGVGDPAGDGAGRAQDGVDAAAVGGRVDRDDRGLVLVACGVVPEVEVAGRPAVEEDLVIASGQGAGGIGAVGSGGRRFNQEPVLVNGNLDAGQRLAGVGGGHPAGD
ncbi:MAG: hypothetical protein BWY73_00225 [candidate division TA06 bacterium ADurb.Bin417]|uniref:Uncharacterized protein n=1 Tax=candidate division TA06 bacterium ADurb.Bin417 TaxID=1852828 RepID=A0A1V5MKJ2_UNCT6|nr:MAG: hypothetical protein BWY73_00225 [candidate division TA06 bacterium ADurb.Bin417]